YSLSEDLPSLLHDARMKILLDQSLPALRRVVARAIESGLPIPLMTAAVSSFDGQRSSWLPANLIQALRDRFGGHGFERVDRPRGEIHFADWEGGS
ncbi:MAG: NADP-dependent phosphogluconate dehydrogenase, partial [Treponema sp.]|nr:NADP-dependent phosphogluconate dehydrogenase [Treponema sp.]